MTRPKADEFSLVPDIQTEEGQNCEGLGLIDDAVSASGRTLFRVVNSKPSNRRLLSLNVAAAGAGGHLLSDDVAVCNFSKAPEASYQEGSRLKKINCGLAHLLVQANPRSNLYSLATPASALYI